MAKAMEKKAVEAVESVESVEVADEAKAPAKDVKKPHDPSKDLVEVHCFAPIRINGKEHFGKVQVTRATAETIIEMLSKKKASDQRVHIGREFERTKVDGQLVIRDAATKARVEA